MLILVSAAAKLGIGLGKDNAGRDFSREAKMALPPVLPSYSLVSSLTQ